MALENRVPTPTHLFQSFWIGGFEAACHINEAGTRLDMIAATQHDTQVAGDYARMKSMGMSTVRDAARWTLIESNGGFDFTSFAPMLAAAEAHDMQVMWTLCHYGWPQDVDVLGPQFPSRFAR